MSEMDENQKLFTEFGIEEIEGKQVFVATDETIDREGEILSIDGWDLGNFKKNPVMLWSHNPYEPNIGKWENIRFRTVDGKKKMTMEPVFHRLSDLSKLIAEMVDQGFMKTLSVGFRPFEKDGNRYIKQELLETSFVNIPANPEATDFAMSKGFGEETVKQLFSGKPEEKPVESQKEPETKSTSSDPGAISKLQAEVEELNNKIKRLEVAASSAKPPKSPQSSAGNGRPLSKEKLLKQTIQVANKSLSLHLRLVKEKS